MLEQIKAVIAEDDTALVYSTRSNDVVCCSVHIPRAKRILAEHPDKVLGVYDFRAKDEWIKSDLAWLASK
jgi:hypothetical protein